MFKEGNTENHTTQLHWEINTDQEPYLYAFPHSKAKHYRDPNMAIGAVQPDGTIYYYWIDESGRETSDNVYSMPSEDVLNKLKQAWKKWSQESGESNPFDKIQEGCKEVNMTFKELNEEIEKYVDDEYNHEDLQKALDDIFADISGWAFKFVDLDLMRMYDEGEALQAFPDAEIVRYMKDNGYAVFEITDNCKEEIEEAGVSFEDYKGMIFVSPVLSEMKLQSEVIKGIEEGEF